VDKVQGPQTCIKKQKRTFKIELGKLADTEPAWYKLLMFKASGQMTDLTYALMPIAQMGHENLATITTPYY